jgi:uncharacterized protein YggE
MGEGEAVSAPDVAYITVGVQTQAATAAQSTAETNRLLNAVLDALRGRGVAPRDLQTSGLSVSPQYAPQRQEIVGYQASNTVTVTVNDLSRAGELLDAAIAAGANRVGGLRFGIRDTAALRQRALAEAVRAARANAEALAAESGVRIVGISSIQEEGITGPPPRPLPMAERAVAAAPAAPTPVEPGELHVTARVRVAFRFE